MARLPYFHWKLKGKDTKNTAPTLMLQQEPQPRASPSQSTSASKQVTLSQPTLSKRHAFKAITPSAQIMHEIRIQGLGANAQTWSFDKSSRGKKTIRPWDAQKGQQETSRLPPKQVWFEQRTCKIVEKEQVKFPSMRFVAGATSMSSVPSSETLLGMVRPDLLDDLEEISKLLQETQVDTEATIQVGASSNVRLNISTEEVQNLQERKRAKELDVKNSVLQEIAIVGRSNVGKSTMLNTLTGSPNTARVSSKPGLTRQLNFYRCGDKFVLVDMPGYGFAFAKEEDKESWKELIEEYLGSRRTLRRIYVMIDARHGLKVPDKEFLAMLDKYDPSQ
ncbi:hypothetical protein BGZ65_009670 [Modicella reniformis]|uniref:EngB-type G domain-containing protein n=1 Tax=Modicella reniformis TaxID=1440133 RepID=A0A9P6IN84_9FUNG|nr:hypothetical protein BGZ65_009670 [Modicella reniformis]